MDKFVINGGKRLSGEVEISGAKNASLALMPACILTSGTSILYNTPELNDVYTMIKLMNFLGVETSFKSHVLTVNSEKIISQEAPYEYVKKMRASVYVLGTVINKIRQRKSLVARRMRLGTKAH